MRKEKGFTLFESLITMSIAVVLSSIAVPSFDSSRKNGHMSANINAMHSSLMMARSGSLSRRERVTVCKSSDGASCTTTGNWAQGWVVFVDSDNDASIDINEQIIKVKQQLPGDGISFIGNSLVDDYISYALSGRTQTTGGGIQRGTLVLCDDRGFTHDARAIVLNAVGRARVDHATDRDVSFSSCNS